MQSQTQINTTEKIMIKKAISIFIIAATFTLPSSFAQNRKTIYEGFRGTVQSEIDSMTDKKVGLLFIDFGPYYIAIYNHDKFTIWPNTDGLIFSDSKNNLIRPPNSAPIPLTRVGQKSGLTVENKADASKIIRSIVNGEEVKFRYENFPNYKTTDTTIINKAAGFLYSKAASEFGWANIGQTSDLPQAEVSPYLGKDNEGNPSGYISAGIKLNQYIELKRSDRQFGTSVFIAFGFPRRIETFGHNGTNWISKPNILEKSLKITIQDKDNKIIYEGKTPDFHINQDSIKGIYWPEGENLAKAALKAGPSGSIKITGNTGTNTSSLYGFKELWDWGSSNANLPQITD